MVWVTVVCNFENVTEFSPVLNESRILIYYQFHFM